MSLTSVTSFRSALRGTSVGGANHALAAPASAQRSGDSGRAPAAGAGRESTTAIFRFAQRAVRALFKGGPDANVADRRFAACADWAWVLEASRGSPAWTYERLEALAASPEGASALVQKFCDLDRDFKTVHGVPASLPGVRHPSLERARTHLAAAAARWEDLANAACVRDLPRAVTALRLRFDALAMAGACVAEYDLRPMVTSGGFVAREALAHYGRGEYPAEEESACVRRLADAGLAPRDEAFAASLRRALALGSYYTAFLQLQKRSLAACDARLEAAFPPAHRGWAFREFRHRRAANEAYGRAVERARDPFSVDPDAREAPDDAPPLKIFERSVLYALGFEAKTVSDLVEEARQDAAREALAASN